MNKDVFIALIKKYPLAIICLFVSIGSIATIFVRGDLSSELENEEVSLNSQLKILNTNTKNSVGLAEQVRTLEAIVDSFKSRLIDPEQRAVNTNFFYSLEQLAPIRVASINIRNGNDPNFSKDGPNTLSENRHINCDLSIKGTFQEIVLFLNKIRNVDPFLRVTRVDLRVASSANNAYDADLRLVILSK